MSPSPVRRASPKREPKFENHKRGRSLESLYREKEDDLVLFSKVQNNERDGFLLRFSQTRTLTKSSLRYLSDYKLGIAIPARGESSNLLNADRDKNDYDWLKTPPETPLFRSLDDERQPVKLVPRGKPGNQLTISRSSMMEKDYRSGRGSPSPHRLSLSLWSGNSILQSRSRPFSATQSSPSPTMRCPSPAKRLSPPSSKPAFAPRSTASTPRRMSTGSTSNFAQTKVRGSSPIKTSRGNSTSPKIRAWQTNIPGFSLEAPPNLRTSLSDEPSSHMRRASPVSRDGSRYGKKSMSPIVSRRVASSYSHDRDQFSSYSKRSVASSGDDDVNLPPSIQLNSSKQSPRNIGDCPSNHAMSYSRKPMKKLSSSAPKTSFDLVNQMDHKEPHIRFRPLLSCVPNSTFYTAKASTHHRSITSSNNASSNQAIGGFHDIEGSELNQEDATNRGLERHYPDIEDEVFAMEHVDALSEDIDKSRNMDCYSLGGRLRENEVSVTTVSPSDIAGSIYTLNADSALEIVTCSKCGQILHPIEVVTRREEQICLGCRCSGARSIITDQQKMVMVNQNNTLDLQSNHGSDKVLDQSASISESIQATCAHHAERSCLVTQNSYSDSSLNLSVKLFEEGESYLARQKMPEQSVHSKKDYEKLQHDDELNFYSSLDVSEGAGISLLLRRSSGMKGRIIQSRSFTASATSNDDFSYTRDSVNSTSSIGHTSASVSSSIDLGSSKLTVWPSSGYKSNTDNYRYEMHAKHKRSISSVSSASGHMSQVASFAPIRHVDSREQSLVTEAKSSCSDIENNIVLTSKESSSYENNGNLMNNSHNLLNAEISPVLVDEASSMSCADRMDGVEVRNPSSLNPIAEIEIGKDDVVYYDSNSDVDSTYAKGCTNELQLNDAGAATSTIVKLKISRHLHEESRILVGHTDQGNTKSMTLEEATDVILFCSSIVHNLAYEAANIAIANETLPIEVLQPSVTFMSKSNFERMDIHLTKSSHKPQKAQEKGLGMETAHSSYNAETNEMTSPRIIGPLDDRALDTSDIIKPPKLESKCNCVLM